MLKRLAAMVASASSRFEAVIGLEVHAQLLTTTKAFCSCPTTFGAPPNTQVCPTCLGLPGALPTLNERAVRFAVRTALALGCTIERTSRFARKNYFYPDLPKGYQISQYDEPFSRRGALVLESGKVARITRVHMEEDAGKNIHGASSASESVVDFNRSGVPLVEIVGEPDLSSGEEAAEYLRALREILMFIEVNDGNLEEGSFRCDANVSIRLRGATELGARVELKNINSFRFVERAIAHEIGRQERTIESGGRVVPETRGWNEHEGKTFSMRSKETAQDYRYFPEPDLAPLVLDDAFVASVKSEMPELPRGKRARFVAEYKLSPAAAIVLTQHPRIARLFEDAAKKSGDAVRVANFVQSEVLRDVVTKGLSAEIPASADQIAELMELGASGAISGKQVKEIYGKVKGTARSPRDVVRESGAAQVSDASALEPIVKRIVDANPKQAAELRGGKTGIMGYFVGLVMKETKGSANPKLVNELLKKAIGVP
jgi:aspartyl-tRNA(Asn)/glutamyl-tRNA(Gln) amidotransferase subunit B